ncbi:MAG: hypothetical protein ABFD62_13655 [Syntrophaceae bacterium]
MQRSPALVLAVIFLICFCLAGTGTAQDKTPAPETAKALKTEPAVEEPTPEVNPDVKPDIKPEIKPDVKPDIKPDIRPAELSLGAASPSRGSSNVMILKKSSPGYARWALQGPAGWFPPPEEKYSGMLGPEPLNFKITLKCFPAKEFPADDTTYVPVELVFESAAGSFVFRNELRPGRYKERFSFVFDGAEKGINIYFRVLKKEGPVLLADTHGLDFGSIESGRTVNRTVHVRNPGRGVLSWKAGQPPPSLNNGRYVSLFNQEVRDGGTYYLPSGLNDMVQLQGEWTGVEGCPLGKSGSSIQINFTGTGIIVYGVKDSDPGLLNMRLDDDTTEDIQCGSGYLESTEILVLSGLLEGPHKLVLSRKDGMVFAEGFKVLGSGFLKGPDHWIKIVPDSGTTTSETDFINVTINTAGLAPGIYGDQIEIISNSGRATVDISANVTVSSVPQVFKVFRFTRGRDILYSSNPSAESPRKTAGYAGRALAFSLFREDTPGTRPLCRWYSRSNANHYYTTSREGDKFTRGYVLEGPIGNIATTRLPGTRELYHWYNQSTGIHTYTLDPRGENLPKAKFLYQGIVGYVK